MNNLFIFISAILAGYGLVELFFLATRANKERRFFVIIQIASGFGFCLWIVFDKNLISWPIFLALLFIACDRLQTRLMKKNRPHLFSFFEKETK